MTDGRNRTPDDADLCNTVDHNSAAAGVSTVRDARAVRSARAMEAALLALLARKPLEQITIREVAAEAGVSYATFFRHHPTKEALLDRKPWSRSAQR